MLALCVMFTSVPFDADVYAQEVQEGTEAVLTNGTEEPLEDAPGNTGETAEGTEALPEGGSTEKTENGTPEGEMTEQPESTEGMEPGESTEVPESTEGAEPTEVPESTEGVVPGDGTELPESTEDAESTETTEVPESTEGVEPTEATELPEETETEEEELFAELNYIMVESSRLQTPGTQKIVASLGKADMDLSEIRLVYRNLSTGNAFTADASAKVEDMVLFSASFPDESWAGAYQLSEISYVLDGEQQSIDLLGAEMDIRFGVNTEVETSPDQLLMDENAASSDQVDASVVTMDENGNVVSENNVEDVLSNGISTFKGSSGSKGRNGGQLVVVLDPGHDASHSGAQYYGAGEEDLVFKIAQYCKAELDTYSGVTVYMTRSTTACPNGGSSVSAGTCNEQRVALAAAVGADVYVSFHLNANTNTSANGVGVYYPNSNYNAAIGEEGRGLASSILAKLTALGLSQWSTGTIIWNATYDKYPDGSAADYLGVIRNCKNAGIPAVLIEHAFLSGTSDYINFLSSDEKLKSLGVADATAIAEYYGLGKGSSKPVIEYTQSKMDGALKVKWTAMNNVSYYEVYRSTVKDSGYTQIATVTGAAEYQDQTVTKGQRYYYIIRAVLTNGVPSEYSDAVTGCQLAEANISYVMSKSSKTLEIAWEKVKGAAGYQIYRRNAVTGKYEQVGKVKSVNTTTYVDSVDANNKIYSYKVRAYNTSKGKEGTGEYSSVLTGKAVAKPKISSVEAVDNKTLQIKWKSIGGASGYEITRSTSSNGGYQKIATISSGKTTSYKDTTVKGGQTYYYKIQSVNSNNGKQGVSGYSAAVSGKTIQKTSITSVASKDSGTLEIKWKKIAGAGGYRVKRSTTKNGTYKVIKTYKSANTTSYLDKSVQAGKTYYYKVETLVNSNGKTGSSGDSKEVSGKTIAKTSINYVVSSGSSQMEIGWKSVNGAWGYRIKRCSVKGGSYKTVATVKGKNNTTYKDKSLTAGKTYYYKVETINMTGKTKGYSGNSKAASGKPLAKVSITRVKQENAGTISLNWKGVSGASGYQIYRSTSQNGTYKLIKKVTGANTKSYKDNTVTAGKTYYYKIRAYKNSKHKTGTGSYSAVQKAWTLKKAVISGTTGTAGNKVTLSWDKVPNAGGYRIYRSTNAKIGFKEIKEITSGNTLKYTDTKVSEGKVYYYRIAAIATIKGSDAGRGNYSDTLMVPVLSSGQMSSVTLEGNNRFRIEWSAVKDAEGYQLSIAYTQDGPYQTLLNTEGTSCIHEKVTPGTSYYYKVRPYAVLSNGAKVYGAWSAPKAQTAAYEIMGGSSVTVDQMVRYYNAKYQYPGNVYASKGASTSTAFFTILKEEAEAEGVKAEVLFAQVILETGGLRFGGDVGAEQCNFGGLGATGGGVAGETFSDVRTGLRAQTQHLKAYASTDPLNNACVDSRFKYVSRGCAPYVEWLPIPKNPMGKGWAADPNYDIKLLAIIADVKKL